MIITYFIKYLKKLQKNCTYIKGSLIRVGWKIKKAKKEEGKDIIYFKLLNKKYKRW